MKIKQQLNLKYIYHLVFLITIISCDSKEQKLKDTTVSFQKETYNFKEIPAKEEVSALFTFTNTGKGPLQIKDVKTSCGCTVPEWTKEKIKPNEKGEIKVIYDAKYPGRFNKTITVFYNGKDAPQELIIKGEVAYPDTVEDRETKK